MRYLKMFEDYNPFPDEEKIKQDIKDIFIEAIDSNFTIGVYFSDSIGVEIEHNTEDWFELTDEFYGQMIYLIEYIKDKFPELKYYFNAEIYGAKKGDIYLKRTNLEDYIGHLFSDIVFRFE